MLLRVLIAAVAVMSLVIVAGAGAKTVTVTITKNGYVPSSTTVAQSDTVQFTNSDTVVHQVTFKSTTGLTCTPSPLVIQPSASGSCAFHNAGSYSYSDPNAKGNTFRGTVTVTAAPASLSVAAKPLIVIYGGSSVLSGVLSTQKVGENVDVLAQQCGTSAATKLTTVQTTTGGAYTTAVKPLMNTAYTTKDKALASAAVTVRVRPGLRLAKDRFPSVLAARLRRLEPRGQVRELPALQRNASPLGCRSHRAPEGNLCRRRADRHLDRFVPHVDPLGPARPRHVAAAAGRQLLRTRHEQHDPELSTVKQRRDAFGARRCRSDRMCCSAAMATARGESPHRNHRRRGDPGRLETRWGERAAVSPGIRPKLRGAFVGATVVSVARTC